MSHTFEIQSINWGAVDGLLDSLFKIDTAAEYCKTIVHSGFSGGFVQGCYLYQLDAQSNLSLAAGYGLSYDHLPSTFSTWDSNPIADSVRSKKYVFEGGTESTRPILAIPLLKDSYPIGAMALILGADIKEMPIDSQLVPVLGKLSGWWLSTLTTSGSNRSYGGGTGNGEHLTQRQVQILNHMAQGMVNAEIARELMLSESTIRQETVRIYRELAVPNRAEASKKGRALGLVTRATPPRHDG
jgi:DNA-binding CsgD family transcriptional regulator